MAIPVQSKKGASSANSFGVTFDNPNTAGNLILVVFGAFVGTVTTPTITDSAGNSYASAIGTSGLNTSNFQSQTWVFIVPSCLAFTGNTVTVTTTSGSGHFTLFILEYSAKSLDASSFANENTGTTNLSTGNATTTVASDILVAYGFDAGGSGATITMVTGGYTSELSDNSDNAMQLWDQSGAGIGAQSATLHSSTTHPFHVGIVAIKIPVAVVVGYPKINLVVS